MFISLKILKSYVTTFCSKLDGESLRMKYYFLNSIVYFKVFYVTWKFVHVNGKFFRGEKERLSPWNISGKVFVKFTFQSL